MGAINLRLGRWGWERSGGRYDTARCPNCKRGIVYVEKAGWLHRDNGTPISQHYRQLHLFRY